MLFRLKVGGENRLKPDYHKTVIDPWYSTSSKISRVYWSTLMEMEYAEINNSPFLRFPTIYFEEDTNSVCPPL